MNRFVLLALLGIFVPLGTLAIVPLPAEFSFGTVSMNVAPAFKFQTDFDSSDFLSQAFARYNQVIFSHTPASRIVVSNDVTLATLVVKVSSTDETLQLGVDESYALTVPADGSAATLEAVTVYGALRGIETFAQLVSFNASTGLYFIRSCPWKISDAPRFAYRGLLVDTSRHFLPLPFLESVIDSMSYAKLNTLHWHITDYQSFPLHLDALPLFIKGAYSPGEVYTLDDMRYIVEYARLRGVRVVPEIDVPAHASSWCAGYPEACPAPDCQYPLDPSTNFTFDLLSSLLKELTGGKKRAGVFYDDYLHLGGDEVDATCWTKVARVNSWLQSKNYTTEDGYMYFVDRAHNIATSQGRHSIHWEEVFNHFGSKLDKSTIIHIWLDFATLKKVVSAGYQAILSNEQAWYLDWLQVTWQQMYQNEPFTGIDDPQQQKLVLGGEVCMWGETIDGSDLMPTIWPRAAAAAERLWSPRSVTDLTSIEPRLVDFRCRLLWRGIGAAPLHNDGARKAPPGPGGCSQ